MFEPQATPYGASFSPYGLREEFTEFGFQQQTPLTLFCVGGGPCGSGEAGHGTGIGASAGGPGHNVGAVTAVGGMALGAHAVFNTPAGFGGAHGSDYHAHHTLSVHSNSQVAIPVTNGHKHHQQHHPSGQHSRHNSHQQHPGQPQIQHHQNHQNNHHQTSPQISQQAARAVAAFTAHTNHDIPRSRSIGMEAEIQDDLAAQEAAAREYKPDLDGPLVGEKTTSHAITEEYAKADQIYVAKTIAIPQTYSHYRPIQGDGNCGWRAIGFSYFETLIHTATLAKVNAELERITNLNQFILNVGGYDPFVWEDMVEETLGLFNEIAANLTNPDAAMAVLMDRFNKPEVSNAIIYHLRLLAASYLKGTPKYEPFIPSEGGIPAYCNGTIEPIDREIDHLGIILLVDVLLKPADFTLEIAYLDRSPGSEVNVYRFPEEARGQDESSLGPIIYLLFRPDHYDILYKPAPQPLDIQVNRVSSFSHGHQISANTGLGLDAFSAVNFGALAMIPGFGAPMEGISGMSAISAVSPFPLQPTQSLISEVSFSSSPKAPASCGSWDVRSYSTDATPVPPPSRMPMPTASAVTPAPMAATVPPTLAPAPPKKQLKPYQPKQQSPPYKSEPRDTPSPTTPNLMRFSKYNYPMLEAGSSDLNAVSPDDRPLSEQQTMTTAMFKNSHYNIAHYNNPHFQPEEYRPDDEDAGAAESHHSYSSGGGGGGGSSSNNKRKKRERSTPKAQGQDCD